MARTTTAGAPVGDTVVSFLRGAVERHGPRDALLFKPAFRYLRWSYSRLWKESGQVATLLQRRGLVKGDQVILWGTQLAPLGAHPIRLHSGRDHRGPVGPSQRPRLRRAGRVEDHAKAGLHVAVYAERRGGTGSPGDSIRRPGSRHRRVARTGGRAHRSGRPCRDHVHVRHHGRPQGSHDYPPQPDRQHKGSVRIYLLAGQRPGYCQSFR